MLLIFSKGALFNLGKEATGCQFSGCLALVSAHDNLVHVVIKDLGEHPADNEKLGYDNP